MPVKVLISIVKDWYEWLVSGLVHLLSNDPFRRTGLMPCSVTGGGRQGGRVPPRDFWPGNFCWRIGKKEARKKGKRGENGEEKKETFKREGGKLEMEVGKEVRTFFVFCFFFWLFTFENDGNLWGLPKWEFATGKKHFTLGKNQEKWLCPLRKIYLLCPCIEVEVNVQYKTEAYKHDKLTL